MENNHIKRPDLCPGQLSIFDVKPEANKISSLRIMGAKGIGILTIAERGVISRAKNCVSLCSKDAGIEAKQNSIPLRLPFERPSLLLKPPFFMSLFGESLSNLIHVLRLYAENRADADDKLLITSILKRIEEECSQTPI